MNVAMLKATWQAFNDDKIPRLAAAIAYSTIFSLAPLFVILIAIVGTVLDAGGKHGGHASAENALLSEIRRNAGDSAAIAVRQLIEAGFNKPRQGTLAQVLGWIAFAIGASGLFASLQDALNTVWQVTSRRGGWKTLVRDRLASFGMIVVVGFLLVLTFVANGVVAFARTSVSSRVPLFESPLVITTIDQVVTVALATVIFALIFKILPDADVAWRDVWTGAAITAVLFVVGEMLIALYIAKAGIASAYGAAGSILVALLWIYYSAIILLLGAEFTKVFAFASRDDSSRTARATAVSRGDSSAEANVNMPSSR